MNYKKLTSVILAAGILCTGVFCGCTGGTTNTVSNSGASAVSTVQSGASSDTLSLPEDGGFKTVSYELSKDKYRTFYEIFPYSFYDSNGDGIGDLKGITSKLDYLNDGDTKTTDDLGIEGIWLMPIMPSPSYHKYNVKDYCEIDPSYGTMDDFKELLSEAHKRNINVIIDLVLNHTSKQHEWYKNAIKELKEGKTDGYAQYYHFERNNKSSGWRPTEALRKELQDVVKFWLDMGLDGFRLDAVLWFESTGNNDSIEDLKWLYDYAKSVKEDVYMVGECWSDSVTVSNYYKSGVDSFFDFAEEGSTGRVSTAVRDENALEYVKGIANYKKLIEEKNPDAINTPFISNHDTGRSAGFFMTDTARRMAASLYILIPGDSFIYYGEEIAMTGSSTDPDKRAGMYWSSTDKTGYVEKIPGQTQNNLPEKAVDEQLKDDNSLLNFYKRVIALKNQNPEIENGTLTVVDVGSKAAAGYICDANGSKVLVMFNAGSKSAKVTVPEDVFKINEVRGYLLADAGDNQSPAAGADKINAILGGGTAKEESKSEEDNIKEFSVSGQEITMPPFSTIVLK